LRIIGAIRALTHAGGSSRQIARLIGFDDVATATIYNPPAHHDPATMEILGTSAVEIFWNLQAPSLKRERLPQFTQDSA